MRSLMPDHGRFAVSDSDTQVDQTFGFWRRTKYWVVTQHEATGDLTMHA